MKKLNSVIISGKEVLPIIEGGKGLSVSIGKTTGAFAKQNAVGTFSGVNADSYMENGEIIPQIYNTKLSRKEKYAKLKEYAVNGAIAQAKIAHEISNGNGRIHMNMLWEAAGTVEIMTEVLPQTKGMIHGVVCGAGMPYILAEIAASNNVYYYPIVSSSRALSALWRRSYNKYPDLLGGVVYEDPWKAGGHNGLSNAEDPNEPQSPYERLIDIRKFLVSIGKPETPIIMAGGVWYLRDWQDYIDNKEIGPIAFQFGTRPLLTAESPVSDLWRDVLMSLKNGDVVLNKFSPTGFYSSAVRNKFMMSLENRSNRQVIISNEADNDYCEAIEINALGKKGYVKKVDAINIINWHNQGFDTMLKTPEGTTIFVTKQEAMQIRVDQSNCMGCLSYCQFSNWSTHNDNFNTGKLPDPRSFCIQKSLQDAAHFGNVDNNLIFAGHQAFNFANDPLFANGNKPTIAELINNIMVGN